MMLIDIIWTAIALSLCTGVILGAYFYNKLSPIYRLVTFYLLFSIVSGWLSDYFANKEGYNLFLLPVFSFIELTIFYILYASFFITKGKVPLRIFTLLVYGLILLDVVFLCDLFDVTTFYAFSKIVTNAAIIVFCLFYFWETLQNKVLIDKEKLVLNLAFISYFSITFITFLSFNFLVNANLAITYPFWILNALSTLFFYLFLIFMIWQHGNSPKSLHSGSQ